MSRNGEYMAMYNLNRIQDNASNMQSLMVQNNTLPEWAKSKLTQSRSHLSNVANYKRSKPLGGPGSHRTFNAAPGQNHHHAKQLGSFYRIYNQLGATNKGYFVGQKLAYPAVAFLAGSIALAGLPLLANKEGELEYTFRGIFKTGLTGAGVLSFLGGAYDKNAAAMAGGAGLLALTSLVYPSETFRLKDGMVDTKYYRQRINKEMDRLYEELWPDGGQFPSAVDIMWSAFNRK